MKKGLKINVLWQQDPPNLGWFEGVLYSLSILFDDESKTEKMDVFENTKIEILHLKKVADQNKVRFHPISFYCISAKHTHNGEISTFQKTDTFEDMFEE